MDTNFNRGFTLIEIAIVLVIVGLLVGMGASMVKPLTQRAKFSETREVVQSAVQSVIGYATASGNRLPDGVTFPTIIRSGKDAWGKNIEYVFDNALTVTTSVCNRGTTNLTVRRCNNAACTGAVVVTNVAFVVLSSGSNYNNQTAASQAISMPTTINVYDADIDGVDNCNDAPAGIRAERYDDIVEMVTIYDLKAKTGCADREIRVVTRNLPLGKVGSSYPAATLSAANGTAPYTWTVTIGTLPSGLTLAGATGVIAGTPMAAGTYPFTVQVTDSAGYTAQQSLSITIDP
ncbi:MAG: putative Ig domain-containing protein [Desulfobacterota bacterium]|nr:putative Ig domain-containing protein [Thermodesulfobacteriota bacterium]